jgi:hypothetical protein
LSNPQMDKRILHLGKWGVDDLRVSGDLTFMADSLCLFIGPFQAAHVLTSLLINRTTDETRLDMKGLNATHLREELMRGRSMNSVCIKRVIDDGVPRLLLCVGSIMARSCVRLVIFRNIMSDLPCGVLILLIDVMTLSVNIRQ